MSRVSGSLVICLLALPVSLIGCGDDDRASTGGTGEGVASEMTDCEGGKLDSGTNLCWQNPPSTDDIDWDGALTYCNDLSLGGHDDWRLPMIQELISLIRGCVDEVATSDLIRSQCGVTDPGCLSDSCWEETTCVYCYPDEGPDDESDGCYWDPALTGRCDAYWSSSSAASSSGNAWLVFFYWSTVDYDDKDVDYRVRCVRSEP